MTFNGSTIHIICVSCKLVLISDLFPINKSDTEILNIVAVRPRSFRSFYFVCAALISNVRVTKSYLLTTHDQWSILCLFVCANDSHIKANPACLWDSWGTNSNGTETLFYFTHTRLQSTRKMKLALRMLMTVPLWGMSSNISQLMNSQSNWK